MLTIRGYEERDWPGVWNIIAPEIRGGKTYAIPTDITETDAHNLWIETPEAAFVAEDAHHKILGTYFIKPNYPGPGSHVCNCGYIVAAHARGRGVAAQMCDHSQQEAVARGYHAMQYNLVVSTNEGAIRLWKKHGFEIAGRLPEAFRDPEYGFVDAFIMYKLLDKVNI